MLGRNVQMVSFELASSQEVFFAGVSEKRSAYTHFETYERTAHFWVPDAAILIKATMYWHLWEMLAGKQKSNLDFWILWCHYVGSGASFGFVG